MYLDGKEIKQVTQQTASDVDQIRRLCSYNHVSGKPHPYSQGTKYGRVFVDGSPHQTHPLTTTSRVVRITREQQPGSFKAAFLTTGRQPIRFFGFMENVRSRHAARRHLITIMFT